VADDGHGRHSPFTEALLQYMQKPTSIDNMFSLVTRVASVVGLTWIRKRTIVVGNGRSLPESPNRTGPGPLAIADAQAIGVLFELAGG
jgi:hypothetical protein